MYVFLLSVLKAVTFLSFIKKTMSFKVTKTWSSKSNRRCRLQTSGKETESVPDTERLELSFSPHNDPLDQGGKRNTPQTTTNVCQNGKSINLYRSHIAKIFALF